MLDDLHLVYAAVTFNTANTAIYMSSVVKIYVVWGFVNLNPFYWFTCFKTLANWGEFRRVSLYDCMAAHTRAGRRHIGMFRLGDVIVAKTTIKSESVLSCMPRVIKGYWLLWLISNTQIFWCGIISDRRGDHGCKEEKTDDNLEGCPVGASGKYVGH